MATLFFSQVFGNDVAPRAMSGIIALSIFGNIVVMTFTASRGMIGTTLPSRIEIKKLTEFQVKQEIAKEGVLPFSLFFASSTTTPYAWLRDRIWPSKLPESQRPPPEQSPVAALFLHWMFTMVMIGATSSRVPNVAYALLVSLYSYTLVILVGFFVASGLLYLRYSEGREWTDNAGFRPWGGPAAAIIYSLVCAFILVASFIPPSAGSPFASRNTDIKWYIVPTVGLCSLVVGYIYYLGFQYVVPRIMKKVLVVEREAVLVKEQGEWVQAMELVEASWVARPGPTSNSANGYEYDMERVTVSVAK